MVFYSLRNLVIGFAITVLVVLLILLYTFSTLRSQEKELGNIQISREALQKLEPALVNLQSFEYALNSFINSGDKQYANFYTDGLIRLQNDSLRLSEIANSDSINKNTAGYLRLAGLLHQMMDFAAFIIRQYEENHFDIAKSELKKGQGLQIITEFKKIVDSLDSNNRRVLSNSYNTSIKLSQKAFVFTGVISGLLILILVGGFLLSYKDIRNRFAAAEQLKKFNEELEKQVKEKTFEINKVFERVTDAFIALDKDWRYTYLNEKAGKMHGRKVEDLIGKNIWTEFPDVVNEPFYSAMHEAMKKQEPQRLQLYYSTTDRWFEDLIYPSPDGISVYYHDITDRKKAEQGIKERIIQLQTLSDNLPDTMIYQVVRELDGKMKFIYVSKNIEKFTGRTYEEVIRDPGILYNVIHEDDRQKILDAEEVSFHNMTAFNIEVRNYSLSGEIRWVHIRSVPRKLADGRVIWDGIHTDITEKKKAEEKLKTSEKKLHQVLSSTAENFYVIDRNYCVTLINKIAERNLEKAWGKSVTAGTNILNLIPDEKDEPIRSSLNKVFAGERVEYELHLSIKDLPQWVMVNYMPIYDDNGLVTGTYIATKDIAERKKAEQAIKESEEKYRAFFENSLDGILLTAADGKVLAANPAACLIFGMTEEEICLAGQNGLVDTTNTNLAVLLDQHKSKGKGELTLLRKNREKFPAEISWAVFANTQGEIRNCMIIRDITERNKAEEELRQTNNRFEMITRTTNDAVWEWNLETGELWSNEMHQYLYGLTLTDPVPTENMWAERIHPDDRQVIVKRQKEALASDKNVFISEYRFNVRGKDYRDIYDRCYIVRNKESKPVRMMGSMMDITERKKVEEQLRQSEERYRSLIEQASDAIMITDITGNFIDVNSGMCVLFGYTKDELLQKNITDVIDPEQLKIDPINFDSISTGHSVLRERRMMRKDGTIVEVEANIKMLPDQRILAIARNITDRKKAEQAIRASEETRRLIMNSALDAIVCMDINGIITVWTPQAEKIFGWKEQEIIGKHLSEMIIPVQYREKHKAGLQHYLETGEGPVISRLIELTALNQKGEEFPVELSIVPIRQEGVEFFCCFLRDITERKKAADQIVLERDLSNSVINSLPGVFYLQDAAGKYLRWNKIFENVSGYTAEEIMKMHALDFFDEQEKPFMSKKRDEVFANGYAEAEATVITRNGSRIPYYFTGQLIQYEGKPCLIGTGIDIAERKKAEDELEQSYKSIRQLTEHLQNIREEERIHIAREIHDELGQQLTVMKMDVSWLNKKMIPGDEHIKQKLKSLSEMLDGTVKTVRRISSELRPSLLDDLGLVAAMEWQLKEFKQRSGIATSLITPETEQQLPDTVKTGLFRIFQESLTNVARHAHAKKVKVSLQYKDRKIVLTVQDDGKGFDKKKTADKRTLGILGMKERTLMMGGEYEITSTPGKGTTVLVAIPEKY
jgi:PAS domain S-box-containing protein